MANRTLHQCRVLVVEDEYMLAEALEMELLDVEAIVLGPVATIGEAMALIQSEHEIDGAILDVNLRGEMTFPVADGLIERGVPFVFTTGYDASMIPTHLQHVERCEKPISISKVTQAIGRLIHP